MRHDAEKIAAGMRKTFGSEATMVELEYAQEQEPLNWAVAADRLRLYLMRLTNRCRRAKKECRKISATVLVDGEYRHVAVVSAKLTAEEMATAWPYGLCRVERIVLNEQRLRELAPIFSTNDEAKSREGEVCPDEEDELQCPHNGHIRCDDTGGCEQCGWNPAVAERRKIEIRRRMGVEKCSGSNKA